MHIAIVCVNGWQSKLCKIDIIRINLPFNNNYNTNNTNNNTDNTSKQQVKSN